VRQQVQAEATRVIRAEVGREPEQLLRAPARHA
jgi:hypothetical protein